MGHHALGSLKNVDCATRILAQVMEKVATIFFILLIHTKLSILLVLTLYRTLITYEANKCLTHHSVSVLDPRRAESEGLRLCEVARSTSYFHHVNSHANK